MGWDDINYSELGKTLGVLLGAYAAVLILDNATAGTVVAAILVVAWHYFMD